MRRRARRDANRRAWPGAVALLVVLAGEGAAQQVTMHPPTTMPAAWERFAVRVANAHQDTATAVTVAVPEAVTVLGVTPVPGWTARHRPAADTAPQRIAWTGGALLPGEFREFAFLGRVVGDARRTDLVFPVTVATRPDAPPLERRLTVAIVGRTQLSPRGAVALAGTALGVALLALIVAAARRRPAS